MVTGMVSDIAVSLYFFLCNYSQFLSSLFPIFTALHVMQTRSSDENSVRPSVRLSHA